LLRGPTTLCVAEGAPIVTSASDTMGCELETALGQVNFILNYIYHYLFKHDMITGNPLTWDIWLRGCLFDHIFSSCSHLLAVLQDHSRSSLLHDPSIWALSF